MGEERVRRIDLRRKIQQIPYTQRAVAPFLGPKFKKEDDLVISKLTIVLIIFPTIDYKFRFLGNLTHHHPDSF